MAAAKQDCLDKNLLQIISGVPSVPQPGDLTTRFYPRNGSRIYEIKALLPEGKKKIKWNSVVFRYCNLNPATIMYNET